MDLDDDGNTIIIKYNFGVKPCDTRAPVCFVRYIQEGLETLFPKFEAAGTEKLMFRSMQPKPRGGHEKTTRRKTTRYQDESPDIAAFADVLTMKVDDDDDVEAMRERRSAGGVALSAARSAVFEPLTYHTTPATIQ